MLEDVAPYLGLVLVLLGLAARGVEPERGTRPAILAIRQEGRISVPRPGVVDLHAQYLDVGATQLRRVLDLVGVGDYHDRLEPRDLFRDPGVGPARGQSC